MSAMAGERRPHRIAWIIGLLLIATGALFTGSGLWIKAKAQLAQVLIASAWAQNQADATTGRQASSQTIASARPWPWADTTPIARLHFDRDDASFIVLAGDSGATLAFGPGHHAASALAGEGGNMVVSAHRDTHFSLLRDARIGERISVERRDGRRVEYAVASLQVIDARDTGAVGPTDDERLTLVTCWPFDAITPGGPLRYVVTALPAPRASTPRISMGD